MPDFRCEAKELVGSFRLVEGGGSEGGGPELYLGWSSPFHYLDGYGSIAQEIAACFLRMGVRLSIHPRDYHPGVRQCGGLGLERWESEAYVPREIVEQLARGAQPDCFYGFNMTWPRECYRHPFARGIALTMFETSLPPADWTWPLNQCRRVVVPCRQNAEAFAARGVDVPIDVAPLGVNAEKWPVGEATGEGEATFTFLMAAGLTHRKNPVGAARAFTAAFAHESDVRLVLKTRGTEDRRSGFISWTRDLPNDGRIRVVAEDSTPEQMLGWMHAADAFVFPSRGEGFGLTPLQAMATGLPVIVSANSGMLEYCDERFNYPVGCVAVPVPDQARGGYPTDWGYVGEWWEPDFDELVARYRQVYTHREHARAVGFAAADWVRRDWTMESVCGRLIDVVIEDAEEEGLI